jgi:hypothetical protein
MKKNGQIALIVLIISAIVMTVGLSLSKKSVVETKITTDEELLKQAFNAAESGVDYYLGTGRTDFTSTDSKTAAKVSANNIGGGANVVNIGGVTLRNKNSYFWMVAHNTDGSLNITHFGAMTMSVCVKNSFNGSLLIAYFYREGGVYKVARVFGNPTAGLAGCAGVSGLGSGMDLTPFIGGGRDPLLLVVKPIGDNTKDADTQIAVVDTGPHFPEQGVEISSTGKAGDLSGVSGAQVNREINVINQYQIPSFMLDAITATGNVLSN